MRSTWNHFITSCRIRLQERQYNEMLSDLVEKAKSDNLAKTKFLASTSHDLKQPCILFHY